MFYLYSLIAGRTFQMEQPLLIGLVSLAIGFALLFLGVPKGGTSPRFLQFDTAVVLYPPLIMAFFAAGVAELLTAYYR
jgi:hypothetical protein